jgi:hypothetical protein
MDCPLNGGKSRVHENIECLYMFLQKSQRPGLPLNEKGSSRIGVITTSIHAEVSKHERDRSPFDTSGRTQGSDAFHVNPR